MEKLEIDIYGTPHPLSNCTDAKGFSFLMQIVVSGVEQAEDTGC